MLSVVLLLLGATYAALPWLARTMLTPVIREALGVPEFVMDVRRLGLGGLDLGPVNLGPEAGVRVGAVQIDWTWSDLIQGRLRTIQVHGLELELRESESGWSVPGLVIPSGSEDSANSSFFLPQIDHVAVNGQVRVQGQAFFLAVPFAVNGTLNASEQALFEVRTVLAGQDVHVHVEALPRTRSWRLVGALSGGSVAALASLVPGLDLPVSGLLDLRADFSSSDQARVSLQLAKARGIVAGQQVNQANATTIEANWDGQQITAHASPLALLAPWPFEFELRQVRLQPDARDSALLACDWTLRLTPSGGVNFAAPMNLDGNLHFQREGNGLRAQVAAALAPVEFALMDIFQGSLDAGDLRCDLYTENNRLQVKATVHCGPLRLAHGSDGDLAVAGLDLNVNATLDGPDGLHGTAQVISGRVTGKHEGTTFALSSLQTEAQFAQNGVLGNATLRTQGQFDASGISGGMQAHLPLAWPVPTTKPGSFSADLAWQKKSLAKISTRLTQESTGYALDGQLVVSPANVQGRLKGQLDYARPGASWLEITSAQVLTLPAGLARFSPALADVTGKANLELSTRLDFESGVPKAPVALRLTDISLHHLAKKIALEGGALNFEMGNALDLRSNPDQRFGFDSLELGTVRLEQGDLRYQMEGPRSFLLEGCTLSWAGGRVGTQAFRVNPAVKDYHVELYCDRVQLAKALEQLGMTQVQGGGTANGRIPLRYTHGSLTFENGFLYSTPGESGVLQVQDADILTAGVLPQSAQFGQLELAVEALKEFAYEWAKISMNTEGRELVIALELDGKPAQPLPFVYDQTIGGFARVTATSPGSVFQGIHLNVNFRLPLDQLLQYRHVLELMNKGG